ncbi:MAG: VWA domain-containing protein [Pyrinomonadaceae bacterium]|nr:VWA domain-containing protein [Pyrinomonadaceae bacterium]
MKHRIAILLASALTLAAPALSFGQTQSGTGRQDDTIVVGTSEVVLDVVVRDKRGRPVRNLAASDFEVYEDGVRQQVKSFRLIARDPEDPEAKSGDTSGKTQTPVVRSIPTTTAAGDSVAGPSAIALVFDRLSPDARTRAHKAALSYLSDGTRGNDFIGVFGIDLSLRVLQPYTNNLNQVRQALERSGSQSSSSHGSGSEQIRGLSDRQAALERSASTLQGATAATGPGGGAQASAAGSALGANAAEQIFAEMTRRSLEVFEMLQRDQQGYATTNGLLAVVNSLRPLPGRKAVIFFSEGIAIPPAVQAYFRSVINSANRANTSIYTVDAAGLRTESGNTEAGREINSLVQRRIRRTDNSLDPTGRPLTMELERNEDLLRLDPQSGLGQLAAETGGFLIRETNDIGPQLRRVDDDLRTYYVLNYVPQNQNYDGRFREISVKLSRSNLDVQSRKGYYAINSSDASPVLSYEAPALAVLNRKLRPDVFPVQAGALNFPEANRIGFTSVLVKSPASVFTYTPDNTKKTYSTDFSIVVLIKDETQQVVRKLSNQYRLSGPLDKVEQAKKSEVLFYRETDLAPGRYMVETVAYDAPTGRASVRTSGVVVPGVEETKLRLSSIVVIGRAEQLKPADQKQNNPLQYGEVLLYPNLYEPISKASSKQIAFFFTVYPIKGASAAPKLIVEVMQNNRALGRIAADLPAADAQNRIQYASALPLDKFQPGEYELKITVNDGQSTAGRTIEFTVEP